MGAIQIGVANDEAAQFARVGYGTDPNLVTPVVPWQGTLSAAQLAMIDALADEILPGTSDEPPPSHVGIAAFFNEWLSAPYPRQVEDRRLVEDGLRTLDAESQARYGNPFVSVSQVERGELVAWLSASQGRIREFFVRYRYLVIGGYFTTDPGMEALGYRGNVPLLSFPPVTSDAQKAIDRELAKLGLA